MDSGIARGLGSFFVGLVAVSLVSVFLLIFGGVEYLLHRNVLESRELITPEIKLHTDGKTVDTIYVYKLK